MDPTGVAVWDSGRLLASLLRSPAAREALIGGPPSTVLELGAGTGELAVELVSDSGFAATLQRYVATDLAERLPALARRVAACGRITTATLSWGELCNAELLEGCATATGFDLVVAADVLYWGGGDVFAEDTLAPLAATLASAVTAADGTVALVAYRERWPRREASFCELCRSRGLRVERCDQDVVAAHAPAMPLDPETAGTLTVLRLTRPEG